MNVHIGYRVRRTADIDREIQHWTEKVEKRLQVFRPELVHLKGLVEQNTAREGTTVSLNLRLPSGQMAVQESATTAIAAIKTAFDDLLGQIGRHKQLLRNSHRRHRRGSNGRRPVPEIPFEQTLAAAAPAIATSDDVRSFINTSFPRLERFVQHELLLRESSGELESCAISVEEVVDEVAARALDEQAEMPDRISLESWFYRLVLKSVDDLTRQLAEHGSDVTLHTPRRRRNELASDEPHLQFHQPDETLTTESSLADRRTPTPEDMAYTDEMIALVQFALEGAAREDREAFILHALEGFSTNEIATITDHRPEQVLQAIDRARHKLRHAFPVQNPFRRKLAQPSGAL